MAETRDPVEVVHGRERREGGGRKATVWLGTQLIGRYATPPSFEGRRGVFGWQPKKGRVIGGLLEKKKWYISPNMIGLWG
jgi:hypothetical protein